MKDSGVVVDAFEHMRFCFGKAGLILQYNVARSEFFDNINLRRRRRRRRNARVGLPMAEVDGSSNVACTSWFSTTYS